MLQTLVLFVTLVTILLNKDNAFNVHKGVGSAKISLAKFVLMDTSNKLENVFLVLQDAALAISQHAFYVHKGFSFPLLYHPNLNLNV